MFREKKKIHCRNRVSALPSTSSHLPAQGLHTSRSHCGGSRQHWAASRGWSLSNLFHPRSIPHGIRRCGSPCQFWCILPTRGKAATKPLKPQASHMIVKCKRRIFRGPLKRYIFAWSTKEMIKISLGPLLSSIWKLQNCYFSRSQVRLQDFCLNALLVDRNSLCQSGNFPFL